MGSDEQDAAIKALASGSNLALAFRVLPRSRRRDMHLFYAFCRIVDDLADEPGLPLKQRREGLIAWRNAVLSGKALPGEPALAGPLRRVFLRHEVPLEWVCEVIAGCEMDLQGTQYHTWEELRRYCYRVASAVGLVSARIFGSTRSDAYAEDLGLALQLTNILRDSAEDFSVSQRIYFPSDELDAFGVSPGSWALSKPPGWDRFMRFQYERAQGFYSTASLLLLPSERRVMVAAEIMKAVYEELLRDMAQDGFRVWACRYRLTRGRKLWLMATVFLKACLAEQAFFPQTTQADGAY